MIATAAPTRAERDRLVVANLALAGRLALRFRGRGLDYEDLVGYGVLGLIRAAELYDPGLGWLFSTYAQGWITQAIGRAVADCGHTVRIPRHLGEAHARVYGRRRPARDRREADRADRAEAAIRSLRRRATAGADGRDPLAGLGAREPGPADRAEAEEDARRALAALDLLPGRDAEVVRRRYGLGREQQTLREVAADLGVSARRVHQIQQRVLRRLRRELAAEEAA
jgi:RNA polymerase primary sigma factor